MTGSVGCQPKAICSLSEQKYMSFRLIAIHLPIYPYIGLRFDAKCTAI
jgi:hypothetical protein